MLVLFRSTDCDSYYADNDDRRPGVLNLKYYKKSASCKSFEYSESELTAGKADAAAAARYCISDFVWKDFLLNASSVI